MYGDFDELSVIDRTSISDQVYYHIKKMILSGELTGGKTHTGRTHRRSIQSQPDSGARGDPKAGGVWLGRHKAAKLRVRRHSVAERSPRHN